MFLRKNNRQLNSNKVLIGLSGGIDSAVSVLLLKKKGFVPTGVFFVFSENSYCNLKKIAALAKKLNIELIVKDFSREFEKKIISYFIKEYQKGKTPNPCVFCNPEIKFKKLFELADEFNIKWVATGHYAIIERKENGTLGLKRALDEDKDQSYFLYRIKKHYLKRLIFPLGKIKKEKVKQIAQENELIFEKNESQDVCFFQAKEKLADFLKSKTNLKKGEIIDEKGKFLGYHSGQTLFTIGQRQGIKLSGGPFFVIKKDVPKNKLIVTSCKEHSRLWAKNIFLERAFWIEARPTSNEKYFFKSRYHAKFSMGKIFYLEAKNIWKVVLKTPQWAMAEGQSLVVYDKDGFVWGGGIIKKVF